MTGLALADALDDDRFHGSIGAKQHGIGKLGYVDVVKSIATTARSIIG
jgi:hypothetical protein